mgnify:CR=1 FL=1
MKLGFIGLGKYGGAIAKAIAERGQIDLSDVIVHDLDQSRTEPYREKGCRVATSWDDVVETADVIVSGLPSTSRLAYEHARELALLVQKATSSKKPRLLVRMDTLIQQICHGEANSRVPVLRIMFGLSLSCETAPIAVMRFDKKAEAQSSGLIALTEEFMAILNRVGFVRHVNDCHGLLLYRFLAGTMMFPVAEAMERRDRRYEDIVKEVYVQFLDDAHTAEIIYNLVKKSTQVLLDMSKWNAMRLLQEITSPGGLTDFLRPSLSGWPEDISKVKGFADYIKSKMVDYENRLIGVSLVASSRMGEEELHRNPLSTSSVDSCVEDAVQRFLDHLGIYCFLWPQVFSYVSLVNGRAKRVEIAQKEADDSWFRDVINQWFLRGYERTGIMVSPQTFFRHFYGYAQITVIHGMSPDKQPATVSSQGLLDRGLGALLDIDVGCLVDDSKENVYVRNLLNQVKKGKLDASDFVSSVEAFNPSDKQRDDFAKNIHPYRSQQLSVDGMIRYCIWVMGAATRPYGTWGNVFIPFSHRDTLPISLHIGIRRWIGAENLSALQSIMSAYFMPALEYDNREKASRLASAAILSRNMSHHIGSHVMPRATVKDVTERLKVLYLGGGSNPGWILPAVERLKTRLDDFIQKKADFLAEVTTDPCSSSDAKRLGQDVIAPFLRNALLLDTIARNEGFGYTDKDHCTLKISLCVATKDKLCKRLLGISPPPYDPVFSLLESEAKRVPEYGVHPDLAAEDPLIAVPGVQGHYALYGILENLIRNAAKHGKDMDGKDERGHPFLHIHLHVEEDGDDYYRLRIWDNRADPRVKKKEAIPDRSGKPVEAERPIAEHLQAWMEAPLIGPLGEVRREAWGIAEIVICANLLAGKTDFAYDRSVVTVSEATTPHAGKPPALTCKGKDESWEPCQANRVVYTLRLLKGKRALFIGARFAEKWSGETLETLTKAGIRVVKSAREFLEHTSGSSRISYPFAVIDEASSGWSELSDEEKKSLRVRLPFRVFRIRTSGDVPEQGRRGETTWDWVLPANPFDMSQNVTADGLVEQLWELWLKSLKINHKLDDTKPVSVNVYLDVGAGEQIFEQWKTATKWFNDKPRIVKLLVQSSGDSRVSEGQAYQAGEALRVGFDRHGHLNMGLLGPDDCYEAFHKRSPDWDLIWSATRPKSDKDLWELPYSLAEAGLFRILVIDERMTERALRLYEDDPEVRKKLLDPPEPGEVVKPCFWHMAWRAKIFIATHLSVAGQEAVALHKDYDNALKEHRQDPKRTCPRLEISIRENGMEATALDLYGDRTISPQVTSLDFDAVLIHQGVLDTHKPPSKPDDALLSWIMKARPWTVVESGRGIPPGLQNKNIRFLAYSVLDQALLPAGVGKLLLTRRLMALPRFVSDSRGGGA